jgi:hypothetical protein
VAGKHFAKAVVLQADGRALMAVLPASHRLNLHELKAEIAAKHLEMLAEDELTKLCPDCELGAFPPFGGLYGVDTLVDRSLAQSEEIVFNTGSHTDAVRRVFREGSHSGTFICLSDMVRLCQCPKVSTSGNAFNLSGVCCVIIVTRWKGRKPHAKGQSRQKKGLLRCAYYRLRVFA